MEETGYPDFENHKKTHEALGRRVDQFRFDFEGAPATFDYDALMEFMSTWLRLHILKVDMEFAAYLKKHRAEKRAEA